MRKTWFPLIASVLSGAMLLAAVFLFLDNVSARAASIGRRTAGIGLSPGYSLTTVPGRIVSYTHILTNSATSTDTLTLRVASSQGWPVLLLGRGYPTGTALLPLQLGANMTDTVVASLTVPITAGGSVDHAVITVTSQLSPSMWITVADVTTVTAYSYLPWVSRNFSRLVNGSFENGLAGWTTGQGPFSVDGGHGSGLPQTETGDQALLGNPDAQHKHLPVGYGYISQTFTLLKPYLELSYRVLSQDIATGTQPYYDTFEVLVNRSPDEILNTDRDSASWNPTGITLTVPSTGGLAFYSGAPGTKDDVGTRLWDSGYLTVTLDLSDLQVKGENVTLCLVLWNREYSSPFYDDQGWYNTWAYVDNLSLRE